MNPFPFAPRFDDSRAPQICQVTRDFRLVLAQYIYQKAHADLAIAEQIEEPKPRFIRQCHKEILHILERSQCLNRHTSLSIGSGLGRVFASGSSTVFGARDFI
jgi:hypothetical protein